jgi:hypothetical protein
MYEGHLGHIFEIPPGYDFAAFCCCCDWVEGFNSLEHAEAAFLKHQDEVHKQSTHYRKRPDGSMVWYSIPAQGSHYNGDDMIGDDGFGTTEHALKEAQATVEKLKEIVREMIPSVEHAMPAPPNHHCGDPNACCDADCAAFARDIDLLDRAKRLLGDKKEKKA